MGSTDGLGGDAEKNKENLKFGGVGERAELDQEEVMERRVGVNVITAHCRKSAKN